jgi:hypothetical protein
MYSKRSSNKTKEAAMTLREAIELVQGVEYSRHRAVYYKSEDREYQECDAVIVDHGEEPSGFILWADCSVINYVLAQYSPERAVQMTIEALA